jgi:ABC-2 type transport system permease protein
MVENILTIYVKEFRHLKRDKRTLFAIIFIPSLALLLYGYALNFDIKHVPIGVVDESRTEQSRELVRMFTSTEYFDYAMTLNSETEVDEAIKDGKITVAMVIPRNFTTHIASGKSAQVQFLIDASNSNTATLIIGYLENILQNYSTKLISRHLRGKGIPISLIAVDYRPRVYYNPDLRSAWFFIPGLIGFIMTILAVVPTSVSIVREKERGTLEHILLAPVSAVEVILGKTALYFVLSLLAAFLVLQTSFLLFGISIHGSILLLGFTTVVFLIGVLSFGVLLSTFTNSQQMAYLLSTLLTLLPTFIFSGFVFPIRSMPALLQIITYIVPARYFLSALRGIVLKGAGLFDLYDLILPLIGFAIALPIAASWRLKQKGF